MAQAQYETSPASRRLICSGCGAEFSCGLSAACWCADETFRLPMPTDSSDCLCPSCLRQAGARTDHTG
ncbi:MAG TPA: cysteine-rich CWC family protein [Bradyrhizobium sp.]|nr:cysteine-rich CWC family protein [Bradyrhizobium sp.]